MGGRFPMPASCRNDVESRLAQIDWSALSTAGGSAETVPKWLWDLRFGHPLVATEGANMLSGSLCHQKGQLASAAEFALPFLIEFIPEVRADLQVEILDMLDGFVACSSPANGYPASGYHARIRSRLQTELHRIVPFMQHESPDARAFAGSILGALGPSAL